MNVFVSHNLLCVHACADIHNLHVCVCTCVRAHMCECVCVYTARRTWKTLFMLHVHSLYITRVIGNAPKYFSVTQFISHCRLIHCRPLLSTYNLTFCILGACMQEFLFILVLCLISCFLPCIILRIIVNGHSYLIFGTLPELSVLAFGVHFNCF